MKLRPFPNYGDVMTADEFKDATAFGTIIPGEDGTGYWATANEYSNVYVQNPRPFWATHVIWFNK